MECRTKNTLKKCYAAHGAALVAFETARLSGKGGHAHIQVVPIPLRFEEVVEETFRKEPGVEWESNPDDALKEAENTKSSYFRVDLPGGQKLVHIIRGRFDLQFGRMVLAKLLGVPERSDWKICALSEEDDRRDVALVKQAYAPFDVALQ